MPFRRDGDEARLWAHLSEPPPKPTDLAEPPARIRRRDRARAREGPRRALPLGRRPRPRRRGGRERTSRRARAARGEGAAATVESPTVTAAASRPVRSTPPPARSARRSRCGRRRRGRCGSACSSRRVPDSDPVRPRAPARADARRLAAGRRHPRGRASTATVPLGLAPELVGACPRPRSGSAHGATGSLAAIDPDTNRSLRRLRPACRGAAPPTWSATAEALWVATRAARAAAPASSARRSARGAGDAHDAAVRYGRPWRRHLDRLNSSTMDRRPDRPHRRLDRRSSTLAVPVRGRHRGECCTPVDVSGRVRGGPNRLDSAWTRPRCGWSTSSRSLGRPCGGLAFGSGRAMDHGRPIRTSSCGTSRILRIARRVSDRRPPGRRHRPREARVGGCERFEHRRARSPREACAASVLRSGYRSTRWRSLRPTTRSGSPASARTSSRGSWLRPTGRGG